MNRANGRAAGRFNKTDAPPSLRKQIAALDEPVDFFAGVCRQGDVQPDNLLLFRRERNLAGLSPSSHHRFVLILNLATRGSVVIDHTPFVLNPGHAILIFPYQFHRYANFQAPHIFWLFITFETARPETLLRLKNLPLPVSPAVCALVESMAAAYPAGRGGNRYAAHTVTLHAALLLEELLRLEATLTPIPGGSPGKAPAAGADDTLPQRIGRLLEANLAHPLHIDDIARQLGVSESHLRNTFRSHFGVSLGRYLRELRLTKALRLIGTTGLTISEIADRCGYDSLFSFSRTFKRKLRIPPREYRRRVAGPADLL